MDLTIELKAIIVSILTGFFAVILYACQSSSWTQFFSIVGVALMIAFASLLSGGLLGFLFGIPRTLKQDQVERAQQNKQGENIPKDKTQKASYQTNTNLEEISDWLTKILVGVGLTQITALPEVLRNFVGFTAIGLGNYPSSGIFSLALLAYFLICGFLSGYLLTRLYLREAFAQADFDALKSTIMSDIQEKTEIDANVLSAVQRQLNPGMDTLPISQEKMNATIQLATPGTKSHAFYLAHEVRSEYWENSKTKYKMERTIPVFRALIASDTDNVYHANHGELGFALKDKIAPNWKEAESELTKAIELRGTWQDKVWLTYEFARAICRIHLDEAFGQKKETEENTKQTILDDLKAAAHSLRLEKCIEKNPDISKWKKINHINN